METQLDNVIEQIEETVETQPQKTFTQEELNVILEKRLAKESKKWESKFNELAEAQKLAQMSEDQKVEYDLNKRLEALEQREQELKAKEDAYNKQTYKATIQAQLSEANLPDVSDMLVNMDAESVVNQINLIKESFQKQLNAQLEAKVKSTASTPIIPQAETKLLTIDEIKSLSTSEYLAQRELVEQSLKALK